MSRPDSARGARIPKLRLHKPSGLGVVTLAGRDVYLGRHGTRECQAAYRKAVAQWLAEGAPTKRAAAAENLTVAELAAAWWPVLERRHAGPRSAKWLDKHRTALKPLVKLFGDDPAAAFGPKKLATYRGELLRTGALCRREVNRRAQVVRRMFAWGVAEELLPASTAHALASLAPLRAGDGGRDSRKVGPVAWEHVEPVLPRISAEVAALVQLQWHSGARSGELLGMRPMDIDRTGAVWTYRPRQHKAERHGKDRVIPFGVKAQNALRPFLARVPLDPGMALFSPARAEAERDAQRRAARRSPLTPSQRKRRPKPNPRRAPSAIYDSASYGKAITRGIDAENAERLRAAMAAAVPEHAEAIARLPVSALIGTKHTPSVNAERVLRAVGGDVEVQRQALDAVEGVKLVPHWHAHQLRHSCATRLRAAIGVEAARAVLGHSNLSTTELYAEQDQERAVQAMILLG